MRDAPGNRVLMLVENQPYPTDVRVRREALALTEAGYRVTVICHARQGQPYAEVLDDVRVLRYPGFFPGSGALGFAWEFGYATLATLALALWVALRYGVDVVHAHNPPDTMFVIGALFKLGGKRFVFDHHDLAPDMYRALFGERASDRIFRLLSLLEHASCRVADQVIATNQSYRAVEIERDHVPPERISVVRNGPDVKRLRPVAPDADMRARAGTILGYVGVMGRQDGVDYLLRALRILIDDLGRRDIYCVLIGPGDALADLKALTAELRLEQHVCFTGPINDHARLASLLSSADICVDPDPQNSYNDRSTMLKLMDYMAVARPIVAFDLTEHRRTAEGAAVFVPGNDERAFAQAIAALIDDPERRERLGCAGRRRVETELAWEHSVANLLQVYQRLLPAARVVPVVRPAGELANDA